MTPEEYHNKILSLVNLSMVNLLRKMLFEYYLERDPRMKKERLNLWMDAKNDIFKVISVLNVMEKHPVQTVHVRTKDGQLFNCSEVKASEVKGNELADLLIEFSKDIEG